MHYVLKLEVTVRYQFMYYVPYLESNTINRGVHYM